MAGFRPHLPPHMILPAKRIINYLRCFTKLRKGRVMLGKCFSAAILLSLTTMLATPETSHDVTQRTTDKKVLLDKTQCLAGPRRIIGIKDARDRLRKNPFHHGADEIAGTEFAKVEEVGRGRAP